MRDRRVKHLRLGVAGALATLGLVVLPWPAPTAQAAVETVDDASFTWAISGYAQKGIFGPWEISAPSGDARKTTTTASALGLSPVPATSLPSGTSTVHAVRFTGGAGTIDRATGEASLRWTGRYTVNAYPASLGAPSEVYSDPRLDVAADGSGTLTMELTLAAGQDMSGNPTPPRSFGRLTLMTFSAGAVTGLDDEGYRLVPDYRGVAVTLPAGTTAQTRSCTTSGGATGWWGSWPQDLLSAVGDTSIAAHFYSTGCAGMQDNKPPLPVDVAFGSPDEPTTPTPTTPTPTTPSPTPSTPEPDDGADPGADAWTVDDAQLRWGVNNESNNRSHAPERYNFLSAGKLPDPGRGGQSVTAKQWRQASGDVRIEKYVDGKGYVPATWNGLRTGSDGALDTSPSDAVFTRHQVVLDGGTGRIDPATDSGTIRWKGSFSVVFYSGFTFFHVSDPTLVVRDGRAHVTATLSGYGSDQSDQSVWRAVPARTVTLAELGRVDLEGDAGFTVSPAYDRVKVDVGGGTPQVRTGTGWGSFPQSFVDFQRAVGTAAFWYSSGGATDAAKKALPLSVSYDADAPVSPVVPEDAAPPAPASPGGSVPGTTSAPAAATAPAATAPVPAGAPVPLASGPAQTLAGAPAVRPASATTSGVLSGDRGWWLGGGLLLAAAGAALPLPLPRLRRA